MKVSSLPPGQTPTKPGQKIFFSYPAKDSNSPNRNTPLNLVFFSLTKIVTGIVCCWNSPGANSSAKVLFHVCITLFSMDVHFLLVADDDEKVNSP